MFLRSEDGAPLAPIEGTFITRHNYDKQEYYLRERARSGSLIETPDNLRATLAACYISHLTNMLPQRRAARPEFQRLRLEAVPKVLEASQRMQALMEINCQQPWPVPPMPVPKQTMPLQANGEALRSAVSECSDVLEGVSMNKLSAKGELVNIDVANLREDAGVVQQLYATQLAHGLVAVREVGSEPIREGQERVQYLSKPGHQRASYNIPNLRVPDTIEDAGTSTTSFRQQNHHI